MKARTFTTTREAAQRAGLLFCACGHLETKHATLLEKPGCTQCGCSGYHDERLRTGTRAFRRRKKARS